VNAQRQAVLELLLEHHPALLSMDEVIRVLTAGSRAVAACDAVEVAVRELVELGLAHRVEGFVFATLAAVSFERIDQ
jgi:hypothetical protein